VVGCLLLPRVGVLVVGTQCLSEEVQWTDVAVGYSCLDPPWVRRGVGGQQSIQVSGCSNLCLFTHSDMFIHIPPVLQCLHCGQLPCGWAVA
jgi:hypothetical protein